MNESQFELCLAELGRAKFSSERKVTCRSVPCALRQSLSFGRLASSLVGCLAGSVIPMFNSMYYNISA